MTLALVYLIGWFLYTSVKYSWFSLDGPGIDEWVRQFIIYQLLTERGNPHWLRSTLDFLWSLFSFFCWVVVAACDALLALYYFSRR